MTTPHTAPAATGTAPHSPGAPVRAVLGDPDAVHRTAVLGPVSAAWDGGAFFAGVAAPLLERGHCVTVYDTLSLLHDGDDLAALTARWAAVLAPAPPDVLAGNALGGAVVQALLDRPWTHTARVVLLSAPTVADAALDATLEHIAHAAETEGAAAALALLADVVRGPAPGLPVPAPRAPREEPGPQAVRRLALGLRLLHGADAGPAVRAFPGPLLHVHGTASRLVGRQHLVTGPGHTCRGVEGAGMRPHGDRPDRTRALLDAFLTAHGQKRMR